MRVIEFIVITKDATFPPAYVCVILIEYHSNKSILDLYCNPSYIEMVLHLIEIHNSWHTGHVFVFFLFTLINILPPSSCFHQLVLDMEVTLCVKSSFVIGREE